MKTCEVYGCDNPVYEAGYCCKHYQISRRPIRCCCEIEGCTRIPHKGAARCAKHRTHGNKQGCRGELNPNWNGGSFPYKNHYDMKKNRLQVMRDARGKCAICERRAKVVHHKDGSKDNHSLENLVALCYSCHMRGHAKPERYPALFAA